MGVPTRPSSPLTVVYNPRAFIPHAASLGQACAHCRRFSTAATRRCLGSFSVPVVGVMLSHPLRIVALVSRYLTNQLIRSRPLLRWNLTFAPETITLQEIIGYYPQFPVAIPDPRVRHLPVTTPFAALPPCGVRARLACLIHAANVHSEPGSNPSILYACASQSPANEPGGFRHPARHAQ